MSTLRNQLFPDTNITGYIDRNNQPILVGQKLRDEKGVEVTVCRYNDKFVACDEFNISLITHCISLGLFVSMSEWVEIVVQKPEQNEAPEALAPFRDIKKSASKRKTKRNY